MQKTAPKFLPFYHKASAALAALVLAPALASCAMAEAQTGAANSQPDPAAGEQSAREQGGRQCFFSRQVTGFRNIDEKDGSESDTRILVDVGGADTFEFQLQNRCPELRFARSIAFDQTGVGRICDGLDVDLIVPDTNLGPQRCRVTMVRKLAPGEPGARGRKGVGLPIPDLGGRALLSADPKLAQDRACLFLHAEEARFGKRPGPAVEIAK